jgi:hypothetical protein
MAGEAKRTALYEAGLASALAYHEPKKLERLLKPPAPEKVEATGMIAIPKKRRAKPAPEGGKLGG